MAHDESTYLYQDRYDGVTYLKLILTKIAADSRATSAAIRGRLSRLDSHIVSESKEDIVAFNSSLCLIRVFAMRKKRFEETTIPESKTSFRKLR